MNFDELKLECYAYQHTNPQEYGGWIWQVTDTALNALAEIERNQQYIASLESENAQLKKDVEQLNEYINEMHTDVLKWESENALLRERTRWVPVGERLPEDGVAVNPKERERLDELLEIRKARTWTNAEQLEVARFLAQLQIFMRWTMDHDWSSR